MFIVPFVLQSEFIRKARCTMANNQRDVVGNVNFQNFYAGNRDERENSGDETDALWTLPAGSRPVEVCAMPVPKYASHYKMNHEKRGVALIFSHEEFDWLEPRPGSKKDCKDLKGTLENLGFVVLDFTDLTYTQLLQEVQKVAIMDHKHHDCLLLAVLSHGSKESIHAKDAAYKPDSLWGIFTADKCPSLAGKPKIFFLQACQGNNFDGGVNLVRTETDGEQCNTYKIPVQADFLIVYSTVKGYYSWRSPTEGSWFIQALCQELTRRAMKEDLLTILTFVSQRVAIDFESHDPGNPTRHGQKQVPCIMSMLTRLVRFTDTSKLENGTTGIGKGIFRWMFGGQSKS